MRATTFFRILLLLVLVSAVALPLLQPAVPVRGASSEPPPFARGQILVKFKPGTSPSEKAAVHRRQGGKVLAEIAGIEVQVVKVRTGDEENKALGYARNRQVAYAEPDYFAQAMTDPEDPNDPAFSKQWGLDNDGQVYDGRQGTLDADIDAPEAWARTTGSSAVVIAILDSGIDQDHPDLADKLEGNLNFTDSATADDYYGHGTHVAGIAAAQTGNGVGVAGVGYNASLLNVKVLNDQGWGAYSWIADGIIWAADNGAQVINMSLGSYRRSSTLQDAVDYAWGKGVLLAAAAGNDGTKRKLYPAGYPNCMAVGATDDDDLRVQEPGWWASNYGDWVAVAAPGLYIYSTFPNHSYYIGKSLEYDYGSGTSMASPFVAGLASLLFAQEPSPTNAEVRALIQDTADPVPGTGSDWIHGRINACNAVGGSCTYGGSTPPPEPGGTMHVADMTMDYTTVGKNYFVHTVVIIENEGEGPVADATVELRLSLDDALLSTVSGTTDANGQATLTAKSRQTGTFVAEVIGVTHAAYTYVPDDNVVFSASLTVP